MITKYSPLHIITALILLFSFQLALAAIPPTLNYQGHLTDSSIVPVDGTVSMTFAIYYVESGGTPLWAESILVTANQGVFSVELGAGASPFPVGLFESPLWIGLTVGTDAEMAPRRAVSSVGFSFKAGDADRLEGISAATLDQSAHVTDTANPHSVTAAQTGATTSADIITHTEDESAHHTRYVDLEAQNAMGVIGNTNTLNHVRYTNSEAVSALLAADGPSSMLDADTVDGIHANGFMSVLTDKWVNTTGDAMTGNLTMTGNIGIGVAAPFYKLEVKGGEGRHLGWFENDNNGTGTTSGIFAMGDGRGTGTGAANGGEFWALGGSSSGAATGIKSFSYANGTSDSYAIYADADGGTTTGNEYAFYGIGKGYLSDDLDVNGTSFIGYQQVTGAAQAFSSSIASCPFYASSTCYYANTSVSCPVGKVPLGGGCNTSVSYSAAVVGSYLTSTGWSCKAVGSNSAYTVTAYAACARVGN